MDRILQNTKDCGRGDSILKLKSISEELLKTVLTKLVEITSYKLFFIGVHSHGNSKVITMATH